MTPSQIKVALHYYCFPVDFIERCQSDVDAHAYLVNAGMLDYFPPNTRGDRYKPTDKLCAYVEKLQTIPIPKAVKTIVWDFT